MTAGHNLLGLLHKVGRLLACHNPVASLLALHRMVAGVSCMNEVGSESRIVVAVG